MTWLAVLQSRWTHYALLAVACWFLWERGNNHEARADNCEIARANDRKAYELASKEAEAKALAARTAEEQRHRANQERSDDELERLRASARAATDRYARLMRSQAAGSASGRTSAPGEDNDPEGPERAGPAAILVARDDLDILVENTVRLEAAHAWAKTLNTEPPSPEFGKQTH